MEGEEQLGNLEEMLKITDSISILRDGELLATERSADLTLEEAVEALKPLPATGRIFFTTGDLEYLRHGGRIGRAAAATGALLKVKPLIGYKDAELISDGIAQGRKKSLAKVRELFSAT